MPKCCKNKDSILLSVTCLDRLDTEPKSINGNGFVIYFPFISRELVIYCCDYKNKLFNLSFNF